MDTEYQVVSGKQKMVVHGSGFTTKQSALDWLIKAQRDYGRRGLRIIKLVPYGVNYRQIVELN